MGDVESAAAPSGVCGIVGWVGVGRVCVCGGGGWGSGRDGGLLTPNDTAFTCTAGKLRLLGYVVHHRTLDGRVSVERAPHSHTHTRLGRRTGIGLNNAMTLH